MYSFVAALELIGINPFVQVPAEILAALHAQVGRDKGPIRVRGTLNGQPYQQTLVRYAGLWRLYINLLMLPRSPQRIGELLAITIAYEAAGPVAPKCPAFEKTLAETPEAQRVFERLPPSRQLEIVRYLARLKTKASLAGNLDRAIGFLLGRNRFIGRDRP